MHVVKHIQKQAQNSYMFRHRGATNRDLFIKKERKANSYSRYCVSLIRMINHFIQCISWLMY
jgi:hypothetical protein